MSKMGVFNETAFEELGILNMRVFCDYRQNIQTWHCILIEMPTYRLILWIFGPFLMLNAFISILDTMKVLYDASSSRKWNRLLYKSMVDWCTFEEGYCQITEDDFNEFGDHFLKANGRFILSLVGSQAYPWKLGGIIKDLYDIHKQEGGFLDFENTLASNKLDTLNSNSTTVEVSSISDNPISKSSPAEVASSECSLKKKTTAKHGQTCWFSLGLLIGIVLLLIICTFVYPSVFSAQSTKLDSTSAPTFDKTKCMKTCEATNCNKVRQVTGFFRPGQPLPPILDKAKCMKNCEEIHCNKKTA